MISLKEFNKNKLNQHEEKNKLERLVKELDLKDKVIFTGPLYNREKLDKTKIPEKLHLHS